MEQRSVFELKTPSGATLKVERYRFGSVGGPRITFVAGMRGDAPEGIRVAFRLMRALERMEGQLQGCVEVYPCINTLAAEQGQRLWPGFDVDQNRQFPGNPQGHPPARLAHALMESIRNTQLLVELRGARPGFVELPQAMILAENAEREVVEGVTLLDVARQCNTPILWKRSRGEKGNKTLGHQISNSIIVEGGQGNHLTADVGENLTDGCLYLLTRVGVLPEEDLPFPWVAMDDPIVLADGAVRRARVERAGLFLPSVHLGQQVLEKDELGVVIDPRTAQRIETIYAESHGTVAALRNQPVVSPGDMVARIYNLQQGE